MNQNNMYLDVPIGLFFFRKLYLYFDVIDTLIFRKTINYLTTTKSSLNHMFSIFFSLSTYADFLIK